MIGFSKKNIRCERGSVLLEFAFVLPILSLLLFAGFNLMRGIEVNMLKRDIARSLVLSYACSFKQGDAVRICYQDTVDRMLDYSKYKSVLYGNVDRPEDQELFKYSVYTYALEDTELEEGERNSMHEYRQHECKSDGINDLKVRFVGGVKSSNFEQSKYDIDSVMARAGGVDRPILLRHLFTPGSEDVRGISLACKNGIITISEVFIHVSSPFSFNNIGSHLELYDYAYL